MAVLSRLREAVTAWDRLWRTGANNHRRDTTTTLNTNTTKLILILHLMWIFIKSITASKNQIVAIKDLVYVYKKHISFLFLLKCTLH